MKIYEIGAESISELVRELAVKANIYLPNEIESLLKQGEAEEKMPLAKEALSDILENARLAAAKKMPICQDCGLAVVFAEIGQEVHITGGNFEDTVNEGIRRAYKEAYLRKSVVRDPVFDRKNTGDNAPAVIHTRIVPGSRIELAVSPKGMGSENMSRIFMLKPADGAEGVINAAVETVRLAGPNPCPPVVLGIGVGGNFETVALASKKALLRGANSRNQNKKYADMELEIMRRVNALGIGAGGFGGTVTALDVRIETLPVHIAGMPVAVNICCHALRHAEGVIEGKELRLP